MKRELRRRRFAPLDDHVRVEPDPRGAGLDARAGGAKELASAIVEEVHPDLGQNPKSSDVDRLELVRRQQLRRRLADSGLGPRALLWEARTLAGRPTTVSTSTLTGRRRLGITSSRRRRGEELVVGCHTRILVGRA